ncbi:unnamed protein product [Angiostrongylus costaricensis]|uniref:Col_cuticle_N domain-containing protein n=1 Tax=Angiostrongylus costaricensis TaxID=334426 RepID=A0A0R3PZI4_ANGCS|nr:unnamed protein product [Angiostrongylus costaricensis]
MRVPDILSAFTLNVVLALLSMIMAIVALALLLFVLAKTESEEVVSNKVSSMLRAERSVVEKSIASSSPSSFVTDSGISDEDYSLDTRNFHDSTPKEHRTDTVVESSGWTEEEGAIEPLAQKITVGFECGSSASLC